MKDCFVKIDTSEVLKRGNNTYLKVNYWYENVRYSVILSNTTKVPKFGSTMKYSVLTRNAVSISK